MIPQYSIQEWHEQVPWNTDAMVEQDLIICRALISIFSNRKNDCTRYIIGIMWRVQHKHLIAIVS